MPEPLYAATPTRLLTYSECPRRYRFAYLDEPKPPKRAQMAHNSVGISVHNALRDWWDRVPSERTPSTGARLVEDAWIDVGFQDAAQSARAKERAKAQVRAYLATVDPHRVPRGTERSVSMVTSGMRLQGRIDRLDDRDGELVIVDYKTGSKPLTDDDARFSLPLALYAAAVWKMWRRRCVSVEMHHLPTNTVVRHTHTDESLTRKVKEAASIADDLRKVDAAFVATPGAAQSSLFEARTSALCGWCDFRAHCPEGQAVGPAKEDWAGITFDSAPAE